MPTAHQTVFEIYIVLAVINAFLGVGQGIYQDENPTESIRSPFTGFPLASDFPELNATGLTANITAPLNSTGDAIPWFSDAIANFEATIDILLEFTKFFTAGYIIDLLNSFGFPADFILIITIPLALYVMIMTFVLLTNRLSN